jgi:hypothetical protein
VTNRVAVVLSSTSDLPQTTLIFKACPFNLQLHWYRSDKWCRDELDNEGLNSRFSLQRSQAWHEKNPKWLQLGISEHSWTDNTLLKCWVGDTISVRHE